MSSTPALDPTQQQPSPFPPVIQEQAYKPHSGHHGSVGPVIGVLAVIMVMGAVAVMIGRLCSGRRIMGHGQYDFEGWVETKCSTCIDGRVGPPPRRETAPVPVVVVAAETNGSNSEAAAAAAAAEIPAEEAPPQAEEAANRHQQPQEQQNLNEN